MAACAQTQPVTHGAPALSSPIVIGCSWAPSSWTLVSRAGAPMGCQRRGGDSFPPRRWRSSIPGVSAACAARAATTCLSTAMSARRCWADGEALQRQQDACAEAGSASRTLHLRGSGWRSGCHHQAHRHRGGRGGLRPPLGDVHAVRLPNVVRYRRSSRCSGKLARAAGPAESSAQQSKPPVVTR